MLAVVAVTYLICGLVWHSHHFHKEIHHPSLIHATIGVVFWPIWMLLGALI